MSSDEFEQTPHDKEQAGASSSEPQPEEGKQAETEMEEISYPVSTLPPLPPEAKDEANGGPLGCCMGITAGMFLVALLILGIPLFLAPGNTGEAAAQLATSGPFGGAALPLVLLGAVAGGFAGWIVGKRFYKVYEPPVIKGRRRKKRKSL